jgi:hypothetical protein
MQSMRFIKRHHRMLAFLIFISISIKSFCAGHGENTATYNFNTNWAFYRGDLKKAEADDRRFSLYNSFTLKSS